MKETDYSDIINMKYPNPETEKFFSDKVLRAAQFAPFAALTGHDEAIAEVARWTDEKPELDEYEKEKINEKLVFLIENPTETARITYFVPDDKKSGGAYKTQKCAVSKIKEIERLIITKEGEQIPIDSICAIE